MARRALPILKQLLKTPSDILSRRLTPPRSVTYMPIPADGTPRALTLIPGDDGMEAMHAPAYQAHGDMKKVPMASILKNKVGWATPVGGGGVSSLNLQLRKKLDLVKGGTYASSTATVMVSAPLVKGFITFSYHNPEDTYAFVYALGPTVLRNDLMLLSSEFFVVTTKGCLISPLIRGKTLIRGSDLPVIKPVRGIFQW